MPLQRLYIIKLVIFWWGSEAVEENLR